MSSPSEKERVVDYLSRKGISRKETRNLTLKEICNNNFMNNSIFWEERELNQILRIFKKYKKE
jgi:hypothetical protein